MISPDEFYDMEIRYLPNFSTKMKNALRAINVVKVNDLCSLTKKDLHKAVGIGKGGREDIRNFCNISGLRMSDDR